MKFSPQFLDELRTRLPLSQIVGSIVRLKKSGPSTKGLCPFHKEKTPSFTVNDEKGFYHCFGCGVSGDLFDFIINTQGLGFSEAVEKVADECGMPLPKYYNAEDAVLTKNYLPLLEDACTFFQQHLTSHSKGHDYVKSRGISQALVEKFRLGFAPSTSSLQSYLEKKGYTKEEIKEVGLLAENDQRKDLYPKFRNRLIFPIADRRGRIIAFGGRLLGEGQPKYLNSPESSVFHKRRTLYGLNFALQAIKEKQPVIVCEGYMDVIALHKVGYTGAIAPLGTAMGEEQLEEIWRSCNEPLLCFDGDTAGQQAALRVAHRALPILTPGKSLKFVTLPKGEDPDTLVKNNQLDLLQDLIQTARPLYEVIWDSLVQETQPTTPERQALLFQLLNKLTASIQDTSVKISYQQLLRERFQKTFTSRKSFKAKPFAPSFLKRATFDRMNLQRRILLVTALNHPNIIHEIFEELSTFNLPIAEMNNIRHDIIQWIEENNILDSQMLRSHLYDQGHQENIELLLRGDLYVHAKFASPQATDHQALEGWKDIYRRMVQDPQTSQDVSLVQKELSEDMNEATWLRLKELQKASLDEIERIVE